MFIEIVTLNKQLPRYTEAQVESLNLHFWGLNTWNLQDFIQSSNYWEIHRSIYNELMSS